MDMNLGYLICHQISLTAQHDTSRLGFPALITTLCKARGVQSESRSLENLSPAINLAYINKNYWNLDDPTVAFRGPRKAKDKRSEVPTTLVPPETTTPSSSTAPVPPIQAPAIPLASTQIPLLDSLSTGPSDFVFTPQMLHSMLQSLHRGQSIIIQSLQGLGLPSIMSMDEGASSSSSRGEDELTPPEPFYFDAGVHVAQEEETSRDQIPEPSPVPIPDDVIPFALASELEQPIPQDSPATQVLDLNEHAHEQPQEQDI
ncbi:hypothetical protein GmHk_17G049239 [Glycine max]|nr:hypothetical protein GmHk_17G049239 [Glycine max]